MTKQASSHLGSKNHWHIAGRYRAGAQTAGGALCRLTADALGAGQGIGTTAVIVPVITLHAPAFAGNHHTTDAVSGAGIATDEAMAVAIHSAAATGIDTGTVRIGNTRIGSKSGLLTLQRQLNSLFRGQLPGMPQVQLRQLACHQLRIGKARAVVFRGMPGNRQSSRNRLTHGSITHHRGARRAFALAAINSNRKALVTDKLNRFHFTLTHAGSQAVLQADCHLTGSSPLAPGFGQYMLHLCL